MFRNTLFNIGLRVLPLAPSLTFLAGTYVFSGADDSRREEDEIRRQYPNAEFTSVIHRVGMHGFWTERRVNLNPDHAATSLLRNR